MQLPIWFTQHCDELFDVDAELKDIAHSNDEQNALRFLALLSTGMPAEEALLRCRELLETVRFTRW